MDKSLVVIYCGTFFVDNILLFLLSFTHKNVYLSIVK